MMIFQRVVLLLTLAGAAVAAVPPGIPDGWSDGYVYANGIRIHYYHAVPAPGKPAIVMAHGATDIGLCWTTLTQDLQRSYDIYMTDARGHGLTDPPTSADTADAQVLDLVDFVHAMKFDKPILMGHSMGAATVMRIGAQYPVWRVRLSCSIPASANRVDGDQRRRRQQRPQDAEHSLRRAHL
ncbi:MAG TPA: alpha/beta fold hydrolase [Candidatus Acidoferrales bacterium]|jgi:pimeloyl-ACP methyl ester carboxylesterase|nr:alpha/beta fold hydrolase [Candidatus Acidoferrales bacterium]